MKTEEIWVLVADAAGARLLRADRVTHRLELIRSEVHNKGRQKPHELVSDRPGRSFDSSHAGGRHSMEPDTDLKRAELHRFVHHLAQELDQAVGAGKLDGLVVVMAPRMLGELRAALSQRVTARVRQEIGKDLAGLDLHDLTEHLAADLWPHASR
jgi:protein required for attachment to host cells